MGFPPSMPAPQKRGEEQMEVEAVGKHQPVTCVSRAAKLAILPTTAERAGQDLPEAATIVVSPDTA